MRWYSIKPSFHIAEKWPNILEKLQAAASKSGTIYELAKLHKDIKNDLSQFRHILSVTDTLEYKLARFLVPILLDISQNKFKVQDSFTYVDEIIVI